MNQKYKKIIGFIFVCVGVLALITPFTPGSWLIFVGLECIGIRFIFIEKIKVLLRQKSSIS